MIDLQHQLEQAKQALNRAAADCIRGIPGAAERADLALAEVAALQAVLKASKGRPCPECGRWTLRDRCERHRVPEPAGSSAITARPRSKHSTHSGCSRNHPSRRCCSRRPDRRFGVSGRFCQGVRFSILCGPKSRHSYGFSGC